MQTHLHTHYYHIHRDPPSLTDFISYFLLPFFKLGESQQYFLIDVVLSKELHSALVDDASAVNVPVLLFKLGVLDPVLHLRVHQNKWCKSRKLFLCMHTNCLHFTIHLSRNFFSMGGWGVRQLTLLNHLPFPIQYLSLFHKGLTLGSFTRPLLPVQHVDGPCQCCKLSV